MSQVLPFREVLDINKEYSIQGDVYKISSITTLAGLLRGVRIIILTPRNKKLHKVRFVAWPTDSVNCVIHRMSKVSI